MDDDKTFCVRCGTEYDWYSQEPPANASFYWVPTCPHCGAKMTANPADETWMNIISSDLDKSEDNYEERRAKVHAHARLVHARLVDRDVGELIELAKFLDDKERHNRFGPTGRYHNIAFDLRSEARQKLRA